MDEGVGRSISEFMQSLETVSWPGKHERTALPVASQQTTR
jgi:hypothetical protein